MGRNEAIFGKPKTGNEPLTFEQKIHAKLYEIRQVLNGPANEELKKVQVKEKIEAMLREVSP